MNKVVKENWRFLLFVLITGIIGGYFTGIYSYESLSVDLLSDLQKQNVTKEMLGLVSMIQYGIVYSFVLAAIGILLSQKVNLWKKIEFNKKALIITLIITIPSALLLFPGDKLIFGNLNKWVNDSYINPPTISKVICGFLTGGVTEEIMMRLFLMSLIVFIISKILKKKEIPVYIYVLSNILSALLFAALHLPATSTMTTITPIIVIRCFIFNGGLGLAFGYLYRKYGIVYAMISHGFMHLIADILAIILI